MPYTENNYKSNHLWIEEGRDHSPHAKSKSLEEHK